jgi:hypothetical protein
MCALAAGGAQAQSLSVIGPQARWAVGCPIESVCLPA